MAISRNLAEAELTGIIIGAFYETYRVLGRGFTEAIYMAALAHELTRRGLAVAREVRVCVFYKGEQIGWVRLDMLVEDRVVIEGKAGFLPPDCREQLYGYLNATRFEVGLLLHFGIRPRFERMYVPHTHLTKERSAT
jgi:GxxExxY protein